MLNSILNQETGEWTTNTPRRKTEAASRPFVQSVLEEDEEEEGGRAVDDDLHMVETFVGGIQFDKNSQTYCLPPAPIFHRPSPPPPFHTSPATTLSSLPSPTAGYASSVASEDSFTSYPSPYSSYASFDSARDYLPPVEDLFPLHSTSANSSHLPSNDRSSFSHFSSSAALYDPFGLSKGEFGLVEDGMGGGGFQSWESGRDEDVEMNEHDGKEGSQAGRREEKNEHKAEPTTPHPPPSGSSNPSFFSPSFFSAHNEEDTNPFEVGQYHFSANSPPPPSSSASYFSSNPPHGDHHVPSHSLAPPPSSSMNPTSARARFLARRPSFIAMPASYPFGHAKVKKESSSFGEEAGEKVEVAEEDFGMALARLRKEQGPMKIAFPRLEGFRGGSSG